MLMKYDSTYTQLTVEKPAEIGFLLKAIMVMKETFWLKIQAVSHFTSSDLDFNELSEGILSS